MPVVSEKRLEFTFDNSWDVLKYDGPGMYYKTRLLKNLKGSKAVDFICINANYPLILMEVKDFSQGLPSQQKFNAIPEKIGLKVRDTIAGIIGGSGMADNPERRFFRRSFKKLNVHLRIVYFFEDLQTPARRPPQKTLVKRNVLLKALKQHLRWLTTDINVIGLSNYNDCIDGLTVRRR